MSHTIEPWYYSEDNYICQQGVTDVGIAHILPYDDGIRGVKSAYGEITNANARRIVACVNKLAGYDTVALESMPDGYFHNTITDFITTLRELEQRNAELDALSSAISRDCNAVALERNDYREKLHLANTRIAELVEALNQIAYIANGVQPDSEIVKAIKALAAHKVSS